MRLIDADAVVTIQVYDDMTEETDTKKMTVAEAIDEWSDEGCPPTVDPVKHGEWRYDEALELEWCSECGFGKRKGDKRWYSYCPNCGAYMEADDETN